MISGQISRSNCSKLLFFSVSAISCHRCENSSSLDKCQENQDDVDCPIPVHYCAKIKYESREGKIQTTYRKGCVTKDQCNATSGKIVDCCKGDKCNTSKKKLFFILQNSILFNIVPRDLSFSKWRRHIRKREDPWTRFSQFESCLKRGSLAVSSVVRMFKTSFLWEKSHKVAGEYIYANNSLEFCLYIMS